VDAHAHLLGLGRLLTELDLRGTRSEPEALDRVQEAAAAAPPGAWLLGRGWDQNQWPAARFPDRHGLDARAPDRPVFLVRVDGHAAWVNGRALAAAGIGPATPDPPGGRILRDAATGEPAGVLVDAAMELVRRQIPEPSVEERMELLRRAQARCHEVGLTGVHDMGVDEATLEALRRLEARGELRLRVHALLEMGRVDLGPYLSGPPPRGGGWLAVRGIKAYLDGALGSRGAALLAPYSDDPGNHGLILTEPRELLDLALRAFPRGWQLAAHAIGDRANRLALDVYEEALRRTGVPAESVRPRIEHAQVLSAEDIPRFARLGVIASMQPVHCTSDMDWADERLGPERLPGAYAWRSLLRSGARLAFGSDFPVERPDPLEGILAAVTRQHPDGTPAGGFLPAERLAAEQALRAFTEGAAWASFDEDRLGRIAAGRAADVTVLDRDPTRLAEGTELAGSRVLLTLAGGEIVFQAPPR